MPPLNIQVKCAEVHVSNIITRERNCSVLGGSIPFKNHPFVVSHLHHL